MRKLIWRIRTAYHCKRLLYIDWKTAWECTSSYVNSDDYLYLSPKDAAEAERDAWMECF